MKNTKFDWIDLINTKSSVKVTAMKSASVFKYRFNQKNTICNKIASKVFRNLFNIDT